MKVYITSEWGSITENLKDYMLNDEFFSYTDSNSNVTKWKFPRKTMTNVVYDILGRPVNFIHGSCHYEVTY